MYLTSEIVTDTLAARRFRLLAPLAVLLALVALALAPGIIGTSSSDGVWIDQLVVTARARDDDAASAIAAEPYRGAPPDRCRHGASPSARC